MVELLAGAGGAAVVGLTGAPHCAAMCGAFASGAVRRPGVGVARHEGASWNAGRLAAYASVGALSGAVGGVRIIEAPLGPILALLALTWTAARLADVPMPSLGGRLARAYAPITGLAARLAGRGDPLARFAFGACAATLPCGVLWSGLALAAAAGTALGGAFVMTGFFVGTLPALLAAGRLLGVLRGARPAGRRAAAAAVLALGVWSVTLRAGWLSPEPAPCHVVPSVSHSSLP